MHGAVRFAETVEEVVLCGAQRETPTHVGESRFEVEGVVEDLDDPELSPVV